MNFVIIMTDTQHKSMVGAYGNSKVDTPNLDNLASKGIRFERAYTTCPLCTPARSGIFSGQYPQLNGAWANNMAISRSVPIMGEIFRNYGYKCAYTGKWHLDGGSYYGNGKAEGGFEDKWWFDGKCYAEEIGKEMFQHYSSMKSTQDIRNVNLQKENIWGHRVADKAISFLNSIENDPFILCVSFDEPHAPYGAPVEYLDSTIPDMITKRLNFKADLKEKPNIQKLQATENKDISWEEYAQEAIKYYACNRYIDREIGRVIDEVERLHDKDTVIIYTSDHGTMGMSHGLKEKGPMMYEEITNIPLIVKLPQGPRGMVSQSLVSHLDILPTMLDLAQLEMPDILNGKSMRPVFNNCNEEINEEIIISFSRFAINHNSCGQFYPIRCIVEDKYKLVINLFDSDELYDIESDPYEMVNLIDSQQHFDIRDQLHDKMLEKMDSYRDPFRGYKWGERSWRNVGKQFYFGGAQINKPKGFSFEASDYSST